MRTLNPEQLLQWADESTGVVRLNTDRDVLPGGFMAAMVPMMVAWSSTQIYDGGATAVVRNVNYGGNPFERTTVLQSVRLAIEDVEAVELILVPPRDFGRLAPGHHVQLRFIFEAGKEPELLNLAGHDTGTDARIPDLVLSWESWHAADDSFDFKAGLDETAYGLSLRAYAGAQRYLEDTIRRRNWYAYRLQLPGGRQGLTELLGTSLTLGDGVARRNLAKLLDFQDELPWVGEAPPAKDETAAGRWHEFRQRLARDPELDDVLTPVPEEEQTYQVLVRSCATLTRYLVLLAAKRQLARGDTSSRDIPEPALGEPQPWMQELASTDLLGIFVRAPAALRYLLAHREAVPGNLPTELHKAGLLEDRRGKPLETVYSRDATKPYSSDGIVRAGPNYRG